MKKFLFIAIPAFLVAITLVVSLFFVVKSHHDKIMNEGVDTVGVATQIEQDRKRTGTGTDRRTRTVYSVKYVYTVNGQDYSINSARVRSLSRAESLLAEGDITVRYLEENPNTAITIR